MRFLKLGQNATPIPADTSDKDLVAVTLQDLQRLQQASTPDGGGSCCCKQFVEISAPTEGEGFRFVGSAFQLGTQFTIMNVFSVPPGMDGVINRFGVYEIMPGVMSATRISLLINGEFNNQFPRMAGQVGSGAEAPLNVNVYLKQNDLVSILMDCPFHPFTFAAGGDFLQYSIVFIVSGYYINSGYFKGLSSVSSPGGAC